MAKISLNIGSAVDGNNQKDILNTYSTGCQKTCNDYAGFDSRTKLARFLNQEIFDLDDITQFENKYPLWAGYAIDYQIVKTNSEDILSESQYGQ